MAGGTPTGFPGIVSGRGDSDNAPVEIKADATSQTLRSGVWVWNASTLAWERMTQPSVAGDFDDIEKAVLETKWLDTRYDFTGGELTYKGRNVGHKAATSAATWYVTKYVYSGGDIVRIEGPLVGTWDGRAALAWG